MKAAITGITLARMKNEIHVQFNENVNSLLVKTGVATLEIEALYALYKQAFDDEQEALNLIRKSELTAQISEQDRVRDSVFRGFSDTVKGFRNHFGPDVRDAANKLWNIFLHYGNVSQKTLDAETAAINDMIRELQRPDLALAIERLQVNDWVGKLAEENTKFHHLMMERYNEPVGKTPYRMKTARVATDVYYRAIVAHVENRVLIGAMNPSSEFIVELNAIITRFKTILAQEFGRKTKSKIQSP